MGTYTQFTHTQRYQISALLRIGHRQTEIAETTGVHKATISREIKRNRGKSGYRPKQARIGYSRGRPNRQEFEPSAYLYFNKKKHRKLCCTLSSFFQMGPVGFEPTTRRL